MERSKAKILQATAKSVFIGYIKLMPPSSILPLIDKHSLIKGKKSL